MINSAAGSGLSERLLHRLVDFIGFVRDEGVPVGLGGAVDLGRSLELLPILNRTSVRDICRVALAKSPEEIGKVERAFDQFWEPNADAFPETPTSRESARPHDLAPRTRRPEARDPRRGRTTIDRERELPIGIYSAEAPTAGHPLAPMPDRTLRRLRSASRRFRRECATLPGRRYASRGRGDLDLGATARRAARTAAEWVELAHRAPRLRRANLVILWDVSGSMREHDSELFALVYALRRAVRTTRVFAFSTEITELTQDLAGIPYSRALHALADRLDAPGGGTQIASCLSEFRRVWGSSVRPRTTVVVLSDGWDLGAPEPLAKELAALKRSARALVWVNPYASRPGFSPTTEAMKTALPYVDLLTSPETFPAPLRTSAYPPPSGSEQLGKKRPTGGAASDSAAAHPLRPAE